MKRICFLFFLVGCMAHTQAQVGINTQNPLTSLHVDAAKTDATTPEGIIAPRLTRAQLIAKTNNSQYTTAHAGTFVYVTLLDGTTSTPTDNVTTVGYYYFDGTIWKHFNDKLQNADNGLSVGTTANVQLGGDLVKNTTIDTKTNTLTIANTGGTNTGLKLPTGASMGNVLTSDASGNATWNAPGFSEFRSLNAFISSEIPYNNIGPTAYQIFDTGFSITFPSDGTYLITLGILLLGYNDYTPTGTAFAVQMMPTNNPTNWTSVTNRYRGSYEAFNTSGYIADRIYYSQAITIQPGQSTTAHLMLAVLNTSTVSFSSGKIAILLGEQTGVALNPQATGGSYVKIN